MSKSLLCVAATLAASCALGCGIVSGEPPSSQPAAISTPPAATPSPVPSAGVGGAVLPLAAGSVAAGSPDVRGFRAFCDEWMAKLRERERYNIAHIKWEEDGQRVVGEYVGYSPDCACRAREESGKDPIGKIVYRELRYRREGGTSAEAHAAPSTILEQTEITEIFRFGKGRWQY